MSGSGRRRSSKWDMRDQSPFDEEHPEEDGWTSKSGRPFYHREVGHGWQSPELSGSNGSKWSTLDTNNPRSREPFSGNRGSHKNNEKLDEDRDRDYGTRMSPGLGEWRQQNPSQSPKRDRSRSRSRSRSRGRSRSPGHSLRRESGFLDRSRSRSGVTSQVCKDFIVGRCRRGDHCHFLHDSDEIYDDYWDNTRQKKGGSSKYSNLDTREYTSRSGRSSIPCNDFVKGRCRRGALCRFEHHGASDEFSKLNEGSREKEYDRRKRDASTERGVEHEFRRSSDIPCKFFAAGNCRNGKHCRFSHHTQAYSSPDRKLQDKLALGRKSEDGNQVWDGPKWNDNVTLPDDAKLSVDTGAKSGGLDPSSTNWPVNDGLRKSVNNESSAIAEPGVSKEAAKNNENEALQRKTDGAGTSMSLSGSRHNEKWLEDMDMSPDWNYSVRSANHIVKEDQSHITRRSESFNDMSLKACKQGVAEMVPSRFNGTAQPMMNVDPFFQSKHDLRDVSATALPYDDKSAVRKAINSHADLNIPVNIVSTQSFDQSGQNAGGFPFSSLSSVEQSQTPILNEPRGPIVGNLLNSILSTDGKSILQPEFLDRNPRQVNSGISESPNLVSGEHLKSLSASLVHFLENGQQLPQLYAALTSNNSTGTPSFPNSKGSVFPVSEPIVQHDPVQDSTEPRSQISDNPPSVLPNAEAKTSAPDGKPDTHPKNLIPSDCQADGLVEENNQENKSLTSLEPNVSSAVGKGKKEKGSGESKKAQEDNRKVEKCDVMDGVEKEKATNGKKNKDVKGIRAFKFSLVEFVKDLLKPSWKDGQINKDAYKTIVKKVVDKVTATMQGANIPQTQEKIDNYLSLSKEKLTKLVQAYVEKNQKV